MRRTWIEAAQRFLRETTHKAEHELDCGKLRWLSPHLDKYYLDEITRDVLEVIIDARIINSKPSTVNRYLALIRAILHMARDEWEWITRVPRFRMLKEPKRRVRWLTPHEVVRLLDELPMHLRSMAIFSLATGLRQSNVTLLRWEQVDIDRAMAWIYADQAKARSAIAVLLTDDAIAVLRSQRGQHSEWVFPYRGRAVTRTSTKAWKAAKERAGIDNFRWHDLRHTWASWHAQNGTTMQQLMELGGWASMQMVLRYAHFSAEHLKSAARNLEGVLHYV